MIGVLASVLAVVVPTSPVWAAEAIELDPEEGEIGTEAEITGEDFEESGEETEDYVYVRVYFAADEADEGDEIDDEVDTYRQISFAIKNYIICDSHHYLYVAEYSSIREPVISSSRPKDAARAIPEPSRLF